MEDRAEHILCSGELVLADRPGLVLRNSGKQAQGLLFTERQLSEPGSLCEWERPERTGNREPRPWALVRGPPGSWRKACSSDSPAGVRRDGEVRFSCSTSD